MRYAALIITIFLIVMSSFADDCDPCPTPESTAEPVFDSPYIRVWNKSGDDFENVSINFSGQVVEYGDIDQNTVSQFYEVDEAYRYAPITLTVDDEELSLMIIDYVGETPLEPGYYTYVLSVTDQTIQQQLLKSIFSLEMIGGECLDAVGECSIGYTLYEDGIFAKRSPDGTESSTTVEPEIVETLLEEIADLDFEEVRSYPFKEECPRNYDGDEHIYSFYTDEGLEVLASCEFAIDETQLPFATIMELIYPSEEESD
jgi:hypothetical protein